MAVVRQESRSRIGIVWYDDEAVIHELTSPADREGESR